MNILTLEATSSGLAEDFASRMLIKSQAVAVLAPHSSEKKSFFKLAPFSGYSFTPLPNASPVPRLFVITISEFIITTKVKHYYQKVNLDKPLPSFVPFTASTLPLLPTSVVMMLNRECMVLLCVVCGSAWWG